MQVQGPMEICNDIKNMFHLQVRKEPIVLAEVYVKVPQEDLMGPAEAVQVLLRDLRHRHQLAGQAVFQVLQVVQAEAPVCQVEAAVVHPLHQEDLQLRNNLKNQL